MGRWVGVIMDAPAGATAAALGGGVTNATQTNNNANFDVANNGTITNNINVRAKSGNATVSENVNAGNAKSGNAATAVNIANLTNSSVNLTGWFGILFINVFGSWVGNFGVLKPVAQPAGTGSTSAFAMSTSPTGAHVPKMFSFVPHHTHSTGTTGSGNEGSVNNGQIEDSSAPVSVVRAETTGTTGVLGKHTGGSSAAKSSGAQAKLVGAVMVLVGLALFSSNMVQTLRSRR
jgi:hypothetical protein